MPLLPRMWLYSPDGSRRLQATTDGIDSRPYSFPSQADDGTILTEIDRQFVRLRPDGSRIGAPVPRLGSDTRHSGNVTIMAGPAAPKISPDGTRFAYWISARGIVSCPIFEPGCSYQDTDYTIVSHIDRFTDPAELGAGRARLGRDGRRRHAVSRLRARRHLGPGHLPARRRARPGHLRRP